MMIGNRDWKTCDNRTRQVDREVDDDDDDNNNNNNNNNKTASVV